MNSLKDANNSMSRSGGSTRHGLLKSPCQARAFSLVEVLIAMGIFAVGFVAVAAMFPAGAILQRETVSQIEAQLVARNAAAFVRSARVLFSSDGSKVHDLKGTSGSVDLEPLSTMTGANKKLTDRWKLGDRSYPTAQKTNFDRKYYWVPFIRKNKPVATNKADWSVIVFVLRREANKDYTFASTKIASPVWANAADGPTIPKVVGVTPTSASGTRFNLPNSSNGQPGNDHFPVGAPDGVPDQVRPGDFVADNNANVYIVLDADASGFTIVGGIAPTKTPGTLKLWYAPPTEGRSSSPCVRILLLSGIIEDSP